MPTGQRRTERVDPSSPLSALSEAQRNSLFPLMADGPRVVEELTKRRPDKRTVLRWATPGVAGVRLRTVTVGRCRMTTREWLVQFWAAVDSARSSKSKEATRPGRGLA